ACACSDYAGDEMNYKEHRTTPIIRKGQWLTHGECDKYAQALSNIFIGMRVSSEDFLLKDGTHPKKGSTIPDDVVETDDLGGIRGAWIDGKKIVFWDMFRSKSGEER